MSSADPLYWMRLILAFKRGTLMELGIMPIVVSAMIMNTLLHARFIEVDVTIREDRVLFNTARKSEFNLYFHSSTAGLSIYCIRIHSNFIWLRARDIRLLILWETNFFFISVVAFTIALGQATVYVRSGIYGYPESLGTGICFFIIFQLVGTSVIVIFLDEICEKGYGFGSAVNMFVAANTCEIIFWHAFSPIPFNLLRVRDWESDGVTVPEFEGAIIALFHFLISGLTKGAPSGKLFGEMGSQI